jgi:hypothetical protein
LSDVALVAGTRRSICSAIGTAALFFHALCPKNQDGKTIAKENR